MHLLFCADARPLAAKPTQFWAYPSHANAFLRSAIATRCRSFPSQSTAFPMLSRSVPQLIASLRICATANRSFALANLSAVARGLSIANLVGSELFRRSSARCAPMHFLGNSRHCHAEAARVMSSPRRRYACRIDSMALLVSAARYRTSPLPWSAMPPPMRRSSSRASRPPTRTCPCPSCATGTARADVRSSDTP